MERFKPGKHIAGQVGQSRLLWRSQIPLLADLSQRREERDRILSQPKSLQTHMKEEQANHEDHFLRPNIAEM
jgi:hypothetical protein